MKQYLLNLIILLTLLSSLPLRGETVVHINKNSMTLTLQEGNDTLMTFPISCGRGFGHKQRRGDMRTPEGSYTIVSIEDSRLWTHDFGDGFGVIHGAYGPWFLRLSAGSGIGIHGTHAPESMGLRASEGCIRLRNEDLMQLRPRLKRGIRVEIEADRFPTIPQPWPACLPCQPANHLPSNIR